MDDGLPLVLLVDDDRDSLAAMTSVVSTMPVRIERATDGRRALEMIRELRPAAVVLDLVLPIVSGARVLAALHAEQIDVPVVLVSGAVKAPALGATLDFLPKPCDPDAFRAAITRAIARGARRSKPET